MKELIVGVGAREGGGPETGEGDTFRQSTFSNIFLYMDSAHKTTQGVLNFQFSLLMKWAKLHMDYIRLIK